MKLALLLLLLMIPVNRTMETGNQLARSYNSWATLHNKRMTTTGQQTIDYKEVMQWKETVKQWEKLKPLVEREYQGY